jgi:hypothetical protein
MTMLTLITYVDDLTDKCKRKVMHSNLSLPLTYCQTEMIYILEIVDLNHCRVLLSRCFFIFLKRMQGYYMAIWNGESSL